MKPTRKMIDDEIERQRGVAAGVFSRSKSNPLLYALRLSGDRYYIGRTNDSIVRVEQHMQGKGAQWTKLHAPVALIECKQFRASDPREAEKLETVWTLEYMCRYGWRNVRGGYFCSVDELQTEKALRAHDVFELVQQPASRIR
jgi:predicted GIY-YIG superfamily endonuclease